MNKFLFTNILLHTVYGTKMLCNMKMVKDQISYNQINGMASIKCVKYQSTFIPCSQRSPSEFDSSSSESSLFLSVLIALETNKTIHEQCQSKFNFVHRDQTLQLKYVNSQYKNLDWLKTTHAHCGIIWSTAMTEQFLSNRLIS